MNGAGHTLCPEIVDNAYGSDAAYTAGAGVTWLPTNNPNYTCTGIGEFLYPGSITAGITSYLGPMVCWCEGPGNGGRVRGRHDPLLRNGSGTDPWSRSAQHDYPSSTTLFADTASMEWFDSAGKRSGQSPAKFAYSMLRNTPPCTTPTRLIYRTIRLYADEYRVRPAPTVWIFEDSRLLPSSLG